ncbi:glucosamine-6-phosphate deaminase [Selenomonadales bacterium OttesenSCG-928-I06]|nr:glucosamine-6-phosphate deaminase [Selenomonadales bacterium OttesenSCG-928-I06]
MNIIKVKTNEELSAKASVIIASQVLKNKKSVLGFATGSTPELTYKNLIKMYQDGILDFSSITSFNLDEYCGLEKTNDQSYYYFMMEKLFNHINIKPENINIPDGTSKDVNAECASYESKIKQAGGIDLQILGIGLNGHIGFNEPGKELIYETHQEILTESTLKANARFFKSMDEVPKTAISMGIGTIMSARSILLLGSPGKEDIINATISGVITPEVPASLLRLHSNVTVIYVCS